MRVFPPTAVSDGAEVILWILRGVTRPSVANLDISSRIGRSVHQHVSRTLRPETRAHSGGEGEFPIIMHQRQLALHDVYEFVLH